MKSAMFEKDVQFMINHIVGLPGYCIWRISRTIFKNYPQTLRIRIVTEALRRCTN